MKTGIELIAEEQQRVINVEGYTPEHDDTHIKGELAEAAAYYAIINFDLVKRIEAERTILFFRFSGMILKLESKESVS